MITIDQQLTNGHFVPAGRREVAKLGLLVDKSRVLAGQRPRGQWVLLPGRRREVVELLPRVDQPASALEPTGQQGVLAVAGRREIVKVLVWNECRCFFKSHIRYSDVIVVFGLWTLACPHKAVVAALESSQ